MHGNPAISPLLQHITTLLGAEAWKNTLPTTWTRIQHGFHIGFQGNTWGHWVKRKLSTQHMGILIMRSLMLRKWTEGERTGLFVAQYKIKSYSGLHTVVSSIYAPRFATLALVKSVGGACMWDLTFYLANTPPLPGPRLDADIRTVLYYRPVTEADLTLICLRFSSSRNWMVKID